MHETTKAATRLALLSFITIFAFGAAGCHPYHQPGPPRREAPHFSKNAHHFEHKIPRIRPARS